MYTVQTYAPGHVYQKVNTVTHTGERFMYPGLFTLWNVVARQKPLLASTLQRKPCVVRCVQVVPPPAPSLQELLVVDRDRVPGWVMSKRSALYCPQTLQNPKSLRSPPSMAQLSAAPTAKNGKWIEDIRIIQHLCPLKYQFKYLYPYLNLKW